MILKGLQMPVCETLQEKLKAVMLVVPLIPVLLKTNSNVSPWNIIPGPSYKTVKNMFIFIFNIIPETQTKKNSQRSCGPRKFYLKNPKDHILQFLQC